MRQMYYVDYVTKEIVLIETGFGGREFIEISREPHTIERIKTLESIERALEKDCKQEIKLPFSKKINEHKIERKPYSEHLFDLIIGFVLGFLCGIVLT